MFVCAIAEETPQTKLRKGNVFTPVCQLFCSQGGVCLSACWDTPPSPTPPVRHPLGRHTTLGRHTPLCRHPPQADTPSLADTPQADTPCPVHAEIHPLSSACWDTQCPVHAGIHMTTAADGTHPTGMQSCL